MKPVVAGLILLGIASGAGGHPVVAGYDRFHAAKPSSSGGLLIYNELGCVNCHGGDTGLPARRGPDLTKVATRLNPEWLYKFIADPFRERPGTPMPHLLAGRDGADVEAVVHYFASLSAAPRRQAKLLRHINAGRGKELFHTRGCVACHAPGEDYSPPEGRPSGADLTRGTIDFPKLSDKYVLATLAEFIRDPLATRPDGRMPRIAMEDQDALDIASYLLDLPGSDGEAAPKLVPLIADPTKARRGREVVTTLQCAACHDLPGANAAPTIPLLNTTGGCLADAPIAGVPQYNFNANQRSALQAYLAKRARPLTASQQVELIGHALNCVACHERDGKGGPGAARSAYFMGDHDLGDTGRYPPPLTGIGRKLQPDWLEQAVNGAVRVRPYLKTQMPIYGDSVATLPALLAQADAQSEARLPEGDIEAGRKLLGTQGGVNCIICHSWGERASLGIHALDISNMAARLQPGWLRDYLVDPAAYRPGTLMPSFWPAGKAANQDILGGDTDRQIASILAFARDGEGLPEGFPAIATREFELTPTERPIVLRTFLQDVGTHAILVGFPAGVHLAYDGAECQPALAWKGRFFDGYGTWFSRFAPFEKPLGDELVKWPAVGDAGQRQFEGYRLDAAGVPTFLYSFEGVPVEERFEAIENGLLRSVRWNPEALRSLPLSHPAGVTVTEASDSQPGNAAFVYTW